jgi:hypothetical protein
MPRELLEVLKQLDGACMRLISWCIPRNAVEHGSEREHHRINARENRMLQRLVQLGKQHQLHQAQQLPGVAARAFEHAVDHADHRTLRPEYQLGHLLKAVPLRGRERIHQMDKKGGWVLEGPAALPKLEMRIAAIREEFAGAALGLFPAPLGARYGRDFAFETKRIEDGSGMIWLRLSWATVGTFLFRRPRMAASAIFPKSLYISSVTIDDVKFDALSVNFNLSTHHDGIGMPLMGTQAYRIKVVAEMHDTGNMTFEKVQKLFELSKLVTRDKIKDIKIEF